MPNYRVAGCALLLALHLLRAPPRTPPRSASGAPRRPGPSSPSDSARKMMPNPPDEALQGGS
eukprot:1167318-Alexandrium_andersonii.AAC.1